MGDRVRKVHYFKIDIPDKAGEGATVLGALRDAGVNLLAFTGFPRGRNAQLDLFPEDASALEKAAKKLGYPLSERKTGFLIQGKDRAGAIADIVSRLAAAKISITALAGVAAGEGHFGAILWVKPEDVEKAAKSLGAS